MICWTKGEIQLIVEPGETCNKYSASYMHDEIYILPFFFFDGQNKQKI